MYELTQFTRTELRVLSDMIDEKIKEKTEHIRGIKTFIPDGDVKEDLLTVERKHLSVIREINVRVLTALQIVKDRDTVSQS